MRLRRAAAFAFSTSLAMGCWLAVHPAPSRAALAVVGVDDTLSLKHDRTAVVPAPGVLQNDVNVGSTTVSLTRDVTHGSLDLRPDGGYTYVPDPGYVGTDSFAYLPSGLLSTGATVTITVTNVAPVARADTYSTPSRTTLVVPAPGVLANDSDADGDALVAQLAGGGSSGSIDLDPNGGFTYAPGGGFSGAATFQYRVWDGAAWSALATVTVNVAAATPTPSPTPTPTPTPLLPLPSLIPLPSLGIGSPAPSPSATPSPTGGQQGESPAPSADEDDGGTSLGVGSSSGSAGGGAGQGATGGSSVDPAGGGQAAPVSVGPGGLGVRTSAGRGESLGELGVRILGGIEVAQLWFVPAGVLGGPGILVILWVALQTGAGMAWLPAARRLRREDALPPIGARTEGDRVDRERRAHATA